jgi:hypothetical protein
MYDFLATATDRNGTRSTHNLVAASAAQAVAQLEADGCTDIVLHTDDAGAVAARMTALESGAVTPEDMCDRSSLLESGAVSPEELIDLRFLSGCGYFLFSLKKHLRAMGMAFIVPLAFVTWTAIRGNQLGFLFWIAVAIIAIPFLVPFYLTCFTPARKFDRLMDACAWGRWNAVLELVPHLRGHVPKFELDAREAVALAKMGRVDDGLSRITQHASNAEVPRWMYLGRLAGFYEYIERHDLAIEHYRQAYEDAPDNPTITLDYAISLMKYETDAQEAELLVLSAEQEPLSDMLQLFLPFAYGLRELNNRRYAQAQMFFAEAHRKLTPLGAAQPLFRLVTDNISAYLAIASAKGGDFETAKQHYGRAKKRLEALGANQLLSRLKQAMNVTT